jgi:hypothetical protein
MEICKDRLKEADDFPEKIILEHLVKMGYPSDIIFETCNEKIFGFDKKMINYFFGEYKSYPLEEDLKKNIFDEAREIAIKKGREKSSIHCVPPSGLGGDYCIKICNYQYKKDEMKIVYFKERFEDESEVEKIYVYKKKDLFSQRLIFEAERNKDKIEVHEIRKSN